MIDGLAFLPIEFVEDGMSYLKNIVPVEAEDLLLYFDHTYVNGKFRQGRPCKNNIVVQYRRTPPLFPPTTWNVNLTKLSEGHRTNKMYVKVGTLDYHKWLDKIILKFGN